MAETIYNKAQAQEIADLLKNAWYELTDGNENNFTKELFESINKLTHKALSKDEADEIAQTLKKNLNLHDDIDYLFNYNQQELGKENEKQEFSQENSNQNANSQEQTNKNTQNKDNSQSNSQHNTQNSAENNNANENTAIPPFDKRTAFETSLNKYDKLCAQNENFAELQAIHELDSKLDDDIAQNDKDIALKQKEIEEKQKKLDEQQAARQNDDPNFSSQDIDKNDPLAREKKELQELQEKGRTLQADKVKCKQKIQDSISNMFAAKDIYDIMKNLLEVYRSIKQAQLINKNIKENDKKMKELDEKINSYMKRLNAALQVVGMTQEGKELVYHLSKDLKEAEKDSKSNLANLRQQYDFNEKLKVLFAQRTSTTNIDNNTKDIAKFMERINKEQPNFVKNYPKPFERAMTIIQGKDKTQERTQAQYQGRSA